MFVSDSVGTPDAYTRTNNHEFEETLARSAQQNLLPPPPQPRAWPNDRSGIKRGELALIGLLKFVPMGFRPLSEDCYRAPTVRNRPASAVAPASGAEPLSGAKDGTRTFRNPGLRSRRGHHRQYLGRLPSQRARNSALTLWQSQSLRPQRDGGRFDVQHVWPDERPTKDPLSACKAMR